MTRKLLFTINGTEIFGYINNTVIAFKSKMSIDADGSPRAYHPDSVSGLDDLANAGKPGNWFGILTDNDKPNGIPVKQTATDPAPGFFISPTALSDSFKPDRRDPTRYVNSEEIPYVALPPQLIDFFKKADMGFALNEHNNKLSNFIFADIGPKNKIG